MKSLTYTGPASRRTFGKGDGMSTEIVFVRMEPTEVSEANAAAILEGPHAEQFTEHPEANTLPPGEDDDTPPASEADEKEA